MKKKLSWLNDFILDLRNAQSPISFLGIEFPVITTVLPSLILNDVSVVFPEPPRQGQVFLFKYCVESGGLKQTKRKNGRRSRFDKLSLPSYYTKDL